MAAKRLDAFLRDQPSPLRCQIFVEGSPRLYAVAASPNAEQNGLRRRDRIKVIGEESVTALEDVKRILLSVPAGVTSIDIVVGRRLRTAERGTREVKAGRWSDCALAMQDVIQAWGTGRSGDIEIRGLCAYYEAPLRGRPIGPDDARTLYDWRARAARRGAL